MIRRPALLLLSMLTSALLVGAAARAEEGMWMPDQLPRLGPALRAAGLELAPERLAALTEQPLGAVVSLGGCSASFVSPQGLVVTNHHCVYGSIQYNSTAGRNLLALGFHAATQAEELPAAPGSRLFVTVDSSDVTATVIDRRTARLGGKARLDAIESARKRLIADCERDAGHRCNVVAFHGGLEYRLIKQLEIRDVRLVHAPPDGIGRFGGDTDNWMWPRHTGDYAFYRGYVGRDGRPADFSRDNVPYRPRHHLRIATDGLRDGDFVMVAGYPGRTNRHRLASEVANTFEWNYPQFVALAEKQLALIDAATAGRDSAKIAYANTVAGLNNTLKNRQGMLDGYRQSGLLPRKQQELAALKAWVDADPDRTRQFAPGIAAVKTLIARRQAIARRDFLLGPATPRLLGTARTLHRLAHERRKRDDLARRPGFQARDWPRIRQGLEALDRRYDEVVDRTLTAHFLKQYLAQPADGQNAAFLAALGVRRGMTAAEVDAQLEELYRDSRLDDAATRLSWLDRDPSAFAASDDAFIRAAVALYRNDLAREAEEDALDGDMQRADADYMRALLAWQTSLGRDVYPDANGTLRITHGRVAGRTAGNADGIAWTPFTTLAGIVAKHTGSGEFDAPDLQLAAIRAGAVGGYADPVIGTVPVNFLSTLDITGGNSGSPVLNSRGELVGLAFDGTLDSVLSDWDFNALTTRTIAVDVRYMLWQLDVVDNADSLLAELGVH